MTEAVLVTGGFGFIGCNYIPHLRNIQPKCKIINLDLETYAAEPESLAAFAKNKNYLHVKGDIADGDLLRTLFEEHDIRHVIHFAAESHVDNSIKNPAVFVRTNVLGTFQLLNAAFHHWMQKAHQVKKEYSGSRFVNISTDEVFGSLGEYGLFNEKSCYAPNSPYSASKAGADMIVRSYYHTYGLSVITIHSSNNFGPWQHDEKLIPTIIRKALLGEPIPIYGDGRYVRDWLYVADHCRAIDLIWQQGRPGESYAVGARNEKENIAVARAICSLLDVLYPLEENKVARERAEKARSYSDLIQFVPDRPGHDRRYAIDPSKIEKELGWKAAADFETNLRTTICWFVEKYTGKKVN